MLQVAGYYIRIGTTDSADMKITPLYNAPEEHYRISGTALAGGSALWGPNQGTVDFIAHLEGGRRFRFAEPPYEIRIDVAPNGDLWVGEDVPQSRHGNGVTFGGIYRRAN